MASTNFTTCEKDYHLITKAMTERKRTYLYKSGYIKEDLSEIDPILIQWFESESMAIRHAKAAASISGNQLSDYHIIKCRKTIRGWTEIEGTEKHL